MAYRNDKVNGFLLAIITVFLGISIIPSFSRMAHAQEGKKKVVVVKNDKCEDDYQCIGSHPCEEFGVCDTGKCRYITENPCKREGKKYCIGLSKTEYVCQDCRDDGECGQGEYCNTSIGQCVKGDK